MSWDVSKMNKLKPYLTVEYRRDHPYNIPWRGARPVPFSIYRIPTDLLYYNFNNTRIKAELEGELYKRHQIINRDDKEHIKIVQKILLKSKWIGTETTKLTSDLQKRGQLDPVVATPDGTLIDGNRRLAIFKYLQNKEPDSREFGELETCILPVESTENDLKEFEMRLQMYHQFQVPYGDINTSLEFRYLHKELKWDLDRIEEITGGQYKKTKIQNMINIIDIVDEYLELIPTRGQHRRQYSTLKKGWESFDTIYRMIQWTRRTNPNDKNLVQDRKYFGFTIIRSENTTYGDVRNFYSVLRSEEANRKLINNSNTLQGKRLHDFMDPDRIKYEIRQLEDALEFLKALKANPYRVIEQAYKKLDTINPSQINKKDKKLEPLLKKLLAKIMLMCDQL